VRGATPDGLPYDADDPELLGWVHLALADSLAVAVQRFGRTAFDLDRYLADMAVVGERLAAAHVPRDTVGLSAAWDHYLPQLAATPATAAAHAFLLDPPLPARIRYPYRVLAAAAVATLPSRLRPLVAARPLLPDVPARVVGRAATRLLAVVLGESPAARAARTRTARTRDAA
jgi:uncharacterized protein (DUF2236 family)